MIRKSSELSGSFTEASPLKLPDLKNLYTQRSRRLMMLTNPDTNLPHPLKDYLLFVAEVVKAQAHVLQTLPPIDEAHREMAFPATLTVNWRNYPLRDPAVKCGDYWQNLFNAFLDHLNDNPVIQSQPVVHTLTRKLRQISKNQHEVTVTRLLARDRSALGADAALFYWSALSLYFAMLSRSVPLEIMEEPGVPRQFCPLCGSDPVASVVSGAPPEGVRYLHCGLCDNEWRVTRAQCTNCESSGKIHYWFLDDHHAYVKAESCDDCKSYLKVVYQTLDPLVDPVADDLASIALDYQMEIQGFARSALNPLLFSTP
ncbi:MAG: formate dehydrogenase accessory protein FdhE [Burkholderiales bacterium]|jgi:FdhE protein|nr:formate dehydrogenase accessory protein FdhE [Burkholderiales bacterium]